MAAPAGRMKMTRQRAPGLREVRLVVVFPIEQGEWNSGTAAALRSMTQGVDVQHCPL